MFALLFSLSLPNSDTASHINIPGGTWYKLFTRKTGEEAIFSLLPATVCSFPLLARTSLALSSLIEWWCRIEPTDVMLGALSNRFSFSITFAINSKYHHGGIQTPGPALFVAAFQSTLTALQCNVVFFLPMSLCISLSDKYS